MLAETVIVATLTYPLMVFAYFMKKKKKIHIPIMVSLMIFDLLMPFYLYATRDWKTRLIDDGDILSFMVWTHIGLLIALFVLYGLQIAAGRRLLKGDVTARPEHRSVAKGLLLVRALVIASGALLVQAES
jgi:hypothetical protein